MVRIPCLFRDILSTRLTRLVAVYYDEDKADDEEVEASPSSAPGRIPIVSSVTDAAVNFVRKARGSASAS